MTYRIIYAKQTKFMTGSSSAERVTAKGALMITCTNCGTNNRDDAKFCKGCGQSLLCSETATQDLEAAGFFCSACGHGNRAEARFCVDCGAQLGLAAPLPPSPLVPLPSKAATTKFPERQSTGAGVVARSAIGPPGPPPSGKHAVFWLTCSLVVIAAAGTTAWWLLGRSSLTSISAPADTAAAAAVVINAPPQVAAPASVPTAEITKSTPTSGPHPNWHGTWQGATPDSKMVISPAGVEFFDVSEINGKSEKYFQKCPWVNASEASGNSEESGYAKSSVSLAEILRSYEATVATFRRDPSDLSISDPTQSRRMIGRINPGNYRVVWAYLGGDCGQRDMIIDGDLILSIVNCRYQHKIDLFTRSR